MDWPKLEIGSSEDLRVDDAVVVAGHGGLEDAVAAKLIAKREFAGYWEYVLDEAIFTAPAHPNWGGAALLDASGRLCGIGSLLVQTVGNEGEMAGANMVVPIDLLKPIIDDLRNYGRQNKPPRPWLGWLVQDLGEQLVVAGLYDDGPAETAGLAVGDVVAEVNGETLDSLADMFRTIWNLGPAGVEVPLTILRDNETHHLVVDSADRGAMMKGAAIH
jgi:S1-C subfamily serine protease